MSSQLKVKAFEVVQKHYATIGIISIPLQSSQKYPFSVRVFGGFLLFGCSIASHFVYMFYEANNFMEYMDCICATFASIMLFACFAIINSERTLLFESIDKIEKLIESSKTWGLKHYFLGYNWRIWPISGSKYPKSERFFLKSSQQVDRLSKIVFIAILKLFLLFAMLPKCIVSFSAYYIMDLKTESFQLPIPMW